MSTFAHHRRFAPTIPPETCPVIDLIQTALKDATSTLETVRTANSNLREASQYWRDACEEVSGELDKAKEKIEALEARVEELQDELREEGYRG